MSYFRKKIKSVFKVQDTPHRIALAFALGVFMGISPFLGLHYIGAFAIAWLFRLNKLVAVVGVSVNNPWTIVPISSFCAWLGAKMIGLQQVLPDVDWQNVTLMNIMGKLTDLDTFVIVVRHLLPLIKAFFIGSFVICTISAVASYFIMQGLLARYKKNAQCPIN